MQPPPALSPETLAAQALGEVDPDRGPRAGDQSVDQLRAVPTAPTRRARLHQGRQPDLRSRRAAARHAGGRRGACACSPPERPRRPLSSSRCSRRSRPGGQGPVLGGPQVAGRVRPDLGARRRVRRHHRPRRCGGGDPPWSHAARCGWRRRPTRPGRSPTWPRSPARARAPDVRVAVDNTVATPVLTRPIEFGRRPRGALGHQVPQRPQRRPGRRGGHGAAGSVLGADPVLAPQRRRRRRARSRRGCCNAACARCSCACAAPPRPPSRSPATSTGTPR